MPDKIADDVVVSVQYKLWLDDEEELIEESEAGDPLMYLHGHKNIIPGLETALAGRTVGEKLTVVVEPDEAYGEYDEEDVDEIPLDGLPPDLEPELGMLLEVVDDDDNVFVAEIVELTDEAAILDFNHPLAGERLRFEVEITALRDPTSEELEHGHVHDGDHHHH
jgi:FKBP-type peptidyl-prolyl cis-trans isomerase SlyD